MAIYNTAFGSLPGYNEMLGTTNTTGGGQQQVYGQRAQQQRTAQTAPSPQRTFAQMQQQGVARPAPPTTPQAQAFAQYGGSQQAQQMRQRLQEQLQQFGQAPSRFDAQAFQQIRGAQAANLQQEYQAQQQQLNEELARRGLSASSIGGGRMGDLAGQQARALASLDAQLLQQAAETQAQDRAQLLQAGQGLAELAGAQDLAQFEANRVAQAATFENQLRAAQFGQQQFEQYGQEALQAAQAEEAAQQAARQFDLAATGQAGTLALNLQQLLGQQEVERAQLTGNLGGMSTLAAQQQAEQRRQFDLEQALRSQLGLGGLNIQQQDVGIRQQQVGIEQSRLAQQAQQFQQQLAEEMRQSQAQTGLEQSRLQQQATQFAQQLTEQQQARAQQYGISMGELQLETTRVQNQASQFGQQLSFQQAQQTAQTNLEQQKINENARQFGLQLSDNQTARAQQLGISQQELNLETQRVQNQAAQFGQQLSAQQAQNQAQNNLERARIDQVTSEGAAQRNLQAALQSAELQNRLAQLTEQRITQYGLAETEAFEAMNRQREAQAAETNRLVTSLTAQAQESALQRATQAALTGRELDIRQELGRGEISVQQIAALAQQELARNQLFTQLATLLKSLGA